MALCLWLHGGSSPSPVWTWTGRGHQFRCSVRACASWTTMSCQPCWFACCLCSVSFGVLLRFARWMFVSSSSPHLTSFTAWTIRAVDGSSTSCCFGPAQWAATCWVGSPFNSRIAAFAQWAWLDWRRGSPRTSSSTACSVHPNECSAVQIFPGWVCLECQSETVKMRSAAF